MQLITIVEALLIASEEPLTAARLVDLLLARSDQLSEQLAESDGQAAAELAAQLEVLVGIDEAGVLAAIAQLNEHYTADGRSFQLLERAKGWKLFTRPEFAGVVGHLFPGRKTERLSGPAMETLAIVAYRQPITKAAIEAVRGVSCDAMLQKLLDRELIRIAGRAELPGRPLLYETTDLFYEHFGIRNIDDLPNAQELRKARLPAPENEAPASPTQSEKQLVLSAVGQQHADTTESVPQEDPATTDPADPEAIQPSPEPQQA